MKDKFGREIKVDDYIVYAQDKAKLSFGKVTGVKDNRIQVLGAQSYLRKLNTKVGYLEHSYRIVVVDNPSEEYKRLYESR